LHAERGRRGDVFTAVTRIRLDSQEVFALQQFDLAADGGFSLAKTVSDSALADSGVPFQHHQDFILAEADAQLFPQNLFGLFAHDGSQMMNKVVEIVSRAHPYRLMSNT